MRAVVAVLVLAVAASALSDVESWKMFKTKFGRTYSAREDARRYEVFVNNMRRADRLNKADATATYGVTKFMDLTAEEFVAKWTGVNLTSQRTWMDSLPFFPYVEKKNTVGSDWTNLVSKVKNQGSCGSCWAFSAAAAAEGCYAIKNQETIDLSPQQIIDCCDKSGCDGGCNGGFEYTALEWAMENDIATWDSYAYKGLQGSCKAVKTVGLEAGTCKFHKIAKDEKAMVAALEHNTVTIALDANTLQLYTGGVITSCSGSQLNHALLLVSDEGAKDSYVIKNSWGADWGEEGYFRMIKNKGCLGINLDYHSVAY